MRRVMGLSGYTCIASATVFGPMLRRNIDLTRHQTVVRSPRACRPDASSVPIIEISMPICEFSRRCASRQGVKIYGGKFLSTVFKF